MEELKFGSGGVPNSCSKRSTLAGVGCISDLGLEAMELEFVRGVRMGEALAEKVGRKAEKLGVTLTAHGPYYINLLSSKEGVVERSFERIMKTARRISTAGGVSFTFHAAYYGDYSKEKAYSLMEERLGKLVDQMKSEDLDVWLRPETVGKVSQFGSLDEIIQLSQELDQVMPCVDFAHLHARTNGEYNSKEEWRGVLEKIENKLGKEALKNMHIHASGIKYTSKGEDEHLNLQNSDLNFRDMMEVWKEFEIRGVVISESPNLEEDAKLMKEIWENL